MEFDKTVHDFGTVGQNDGPLECTFTIENTSEADFNIYAVVSSCGCTSVTWTRETVKPGQKGSVSAVFKNEDGPYPFDKTLTVYTSAQRKPYILHLKGKVVKNTKK